ncbi:autotransporter outer membrane beta-barrel domain-containing protein [Enterobacillus tribolii]|uniref:Outer membrane lipase/esterase n=1 Tax=Enterobacillus tribolii TaxID=1487935 RepID=A0A370QUL2_9GAMM|nr:autotransporter domain-containing protein [Enterobacillus tribolii]RDK92928.1 outer membrane lipase/esterase [Enterobacillus tribolii]
MNTCTLPSPRRIALVMLAIAACPALAFDQVVVFGDSLSDNGNVGRFTYDGSQHPLYDDILAQSIGLNLSASAQGGSDYAAGGAVAAPSLNAQNNTQDQVAAYLDTVGGKADGQGLYIHWIGGNDLAAAVLNSAQAQTIVLTSAAGAAQQVDTLLNAGAGTVIVPTVPNIGLTPTLAESIIQAAPLPDQTAALLALHAALNAPATDGADGRLQVIRQAFQAAAAQAGPLSGAVAQQMFDAYTTLSAQTAALTQLYNQQEETLLSQRGGNIVRVDVNALFNEVVANPAQYGFANTAGFACPTGVSSARCSSAMSGFDSSKPFLFADDFHPTPAAHALIGDYMASVLNAPAQVVALTQETAAMARDARAMLDSRLQQLRDNGNIPGSWGVFGGYAGQHYDYAANLAAGDGNATTHNLTVGVDHQITDSWLAGFLISASDDNQQPTPGFTYKGRGLMFSAFSAVNVLDNGWINADLHLMRMNYDDISRSITLGAANRAEQGDTEGNQYGARITAGWDFPVTPAIKTGPVVQFALDYSHVDGYEENGDDSTAMRFSDQNYHSQVGALGWRLDTHFDVINPYAQITYQHQFGDDVYTAGGGIKTSQTTFTRETATQDRNWTDVTVGANLPLTDNVAAFASVSQTGGLSSGEQFLYNVGLSAKF